MVRNQKYVAGWLDSSIHEFVSGFPPRLKDAAFALITCVDSNSDPRSLLGESPELKALLPDAKPIGKGILVPTKVLRETDTKDRLFFGFDEVWFFPTQEIPPKPDSMSIVGPTRIDQKKLNELGSWMSSHDCVLALGDGEGMNFIIRATGLAAHVIGHSLEQSQLGINANGVSRFTSNRC